MRHRMLVLGLALALAVGLPAGARADDTEECEVEVHDDGVLELEYENETAGAACEAVIGLTQGPTAADLGCVAVCRGLLGMVSQEATVAALCAALDAGRVDGGEPVAVSNGSVLTATELCGGAGTFAGTTIVIVDPSLRLGGGGLVQ